jgi:hypothetical protein
MERRIPTLKRKKTQVINYIFQAETITKIKLTYFISLDNSPGIPSSSLNFIIDSGKSLIIFFNWFGFRSTAIIYLIG